MFVDWAENIFCKPDEWQVDKCRKLPNSRHHGRYKLHQNKRNSKIKSTTS